MRSDCEEMAVDVTEKSNEIPLVERQKSSKWPQMLAAVACTIGTFSSGCGMGWTSPVLPVLTDCQDNPQKPAGCAFPGRQFSDVEASWIGSLYNLGALAAGLVAARLMARLGRKRLMQLTTVPLLAGWVVLALAKPLDMGTPYWFYAGRILVAFGCGIFMMTAPLYILEIAEPSWRGGLGILSPFMFTLGIVFVSALGSVLPWDVLTYICAVFPALSLGCLFLVPETPYSLLSRGREREARKSLQWLRGPDYDIKEELVLLRATCEHQKSIGRVPIAQLFRQRVYRMPLALMLTLVFFQQLSGINIIVYYLTDIFLKAGLDLDNGLSAAAFVSASQLVALAFAMVVVDRVGRRLLLLISCCVCFVSISGLATFFYLDEHQSPGQCPTPGQGTSTTTTTPCQTSPDVLDGLGWLPLLALVTYKVAFSVGLGPLPWMMNGEFFPLEAKETSASLCSSFNWLMAFVVTRFEVDLEKSIGVSGAYFLFGGMCAGCAIFVLLFMPETKGKSPEDMKIYFSGRSKKQLHNC